MNIIVVLCLISSWYCTFGNEPSTYLSQPHACYESTSTRRPIAFHFTKEFTNPPPAIRAVFSVNSYDGQNAIPGSYTTMEDHLLLVQSPCLKTIDFGAKSTPITPTHQIFVIKLYMPESIKSFSNIEFTTKMPLIEGTYLLHDNQNLSSIVGHFDPSLGVHLVPQPTVVPDYSKILVHSLYQGKCACVIDGRKIYILGAVNTAYDLVDVGNYKNIEITLIDTSKRKLPKQIFYKIYPAFPCDCRASKDRRGVISVIPKELLTGILTVSFNDIDGVSKKAAKWNILRGYVKMFNPASDFLFDYFAITESIKTYIMLNSPICWYLLEFNTLIRSCGTNGRIKTTSRMFRAQVYEFTYSKEVDIENGKLSQKLTYYSSNFNICDDTEENESLEQTTVSPSNNS